MSKIAKNDLLSEVPFDQYSRQALVANVINSIREEGTEFTILDVGGYKGKTSAFLPTDAVTIVDLFDVDEEGYVKGSGLELPFDSVSFDFVVSFDVLEHVNETDRRRFFDECQRVAKRGVIVCAPHSTAVNRLAERNLNKYYKLIHGTEHAWLSEHIQNGLPDMRGLANYAEQKKLYVTTMFSNSTYLWNLVQGAFFLQEKYPNAPVELIRLNKYLNEKLHDTKGQTDETSYRAVICCFSTSSDMKKATRVFHTRTVSGKEMVTAFLYLQDFYLGLVKGLTASYRNEMDEAERILKVNREELELYKQTLSNIYSSKSWQVLRRAGHIRKALGKLSGRQNGDKNSETNK